MKVWAQKEIIKGRNITTKRIELSDTNIQNQKRAKQWLKKIYL